MKIVSTKEIEQLYAASDSERERVAALIRAGNIEGFWPILDAQASRRMSLKAIDIGSAISISDPRYPAMLRQMYAPPLVLFVQGALEPDDGVMVAIVGARKAGPKMCNLVERLAGELAGRGITVVSGLAYGVDAAAHRGALSIPKGKTIAVLGTPLDRIYPAAHLGLAEQIVQQGGALISEYPSGARVFPSNFLERNRIIAGMSDGVLVAQAGERSGSLATARYALEENRDVMAFPGDVLDPSCAGTNRLIREGATLVSSAQDIFDSYEGRIRSKPNDEEQTFAQNDRCPDWLQACPLDPIPLTEFQLYIPAQLERFSTVLQLELSRFIAILPGEFVQRLR